MRLRGALIPPAPQEGGWIKRAWLQPYTIRDDGLYDCGRFAFDPMRHIRLMIVDPARTEKEIGIKKQHDPDYTVLSAWSIFYEKKRGCPVLLDLVRFRAEGPDIIPVMQEMHRRWKFAIIGVESVGLEMVSQFARRKGLPVREITRNPGNEEAFLATEKDKMSRVLRATALLAEQRLFVPQYAPWLETYIGELITFPNAAHDDCVDVTTDICAVAEKQLSSFIDTMQEGPAQRRRYITSHDRDKPRNPMAGFYGSGPKYRGG